MWSNENDEKLPASLGWAASIQTEGKLLVCPTQGTTNAKSNSYGYNDAVGGLSLGEIPSPTTTILTMDCLNTIADRIMLDLNASADARHNAKVIESFVDGHVELKAPPEPALPGALDIVWNNIPADFTYIPATTPGAGSGLLVAATSGVPVAYSSTPLTGDFTLHYQYVGATFVPAGFIVGLTENTTPAGYADMGSDNTIGVEYDYGYDLVGTYISPTIAMDTDVQLSRVGSTFSVTDGTTSNTFTTGTSATVYVWAQLYLVASGEISNCYVTNP